MPCHLLFHVSKCCEFQTSSIVQNVIEVFSISPIILLITLLFGINGISMLWVCNLEMDSFTLIGCSYTREVK